MTHISVWIITDVNSAEELGRAFQEAEKTAGAFHERNFKTHDPGGEIMPPLHQDGHQVGGRYSGDLETPGGGNWATGEAAAAQPTEAMPKAIITPQAYNVVRESTEDDTEEMRRVLLHWPDNIVVLHDWHY